MILISWCDKWVNHRLSLVDYPVPWTETMSEINLPTVVGDTGYIHTVIGTEDTPMWWCVSGDKFIWYVDSPEKASVFRIRRTIVPINKHIGLWGMCLKPGVDMVPDALTTEPTMLNTSIYNKKIYVLNDGRVFTHEGKWVTYEGGKVITKYKDKWPQRWDIWDAKNIEWGIVIGIFPFIYVSPSLDIPLTKSVFVSFSSHGAGVGMRIAETSLSRFRLGISLDMLPYIGLSCWVTFKRPLTAG